MTSTAQTVTDTLNAYEGDNIWLDVILGVDGYDEEATEAVDDGGGTRFVAAGVTYRYEPSRGAWDVA